MIEVKNLSKAFGDRVVLSELSLTFPEGSTTALMSPSGSGKTTLLRILTGLDNKFEGEATLPSSVSYCPQELSLLPWYSAHKNLTTFLGEDEETLSRIKDGLSAMGLSEDAHKKPKELSGGMCQRIALLRAWLANTNTVILDEPFKALDPETKDTVINYLKATKSPTRTVIFTTHSEEEAEAFADRVIRL